MCFFKGNKVIINGKQINPESKNKKIEFNKTLSNSSEQIDSLNINSDVAVNIFASSSDKITAHLHGEVICEKVELQMNSIENQVNITAKFEYNNSSTSSFTNTVLGNGFVVNKATISIDGINVSFQSNLVLDIAVPYKLFNSISVSVHNSSIVINNSVRSNLIELSCYNGKTNIHATFCELTINSYNGNVYVKSKPISDISLNIKTYNGSTTIILNNTDSSKVDTKAVNGSCIKHCKKNSKYLALGTIISQNGYIDIC